MDATVTQLREDEWEEWAWDHLHRVLSPGGAAMLADVDRTTVYFWIRSGYVRAWSFRAGDIYVDIEDVVNRAVKQGHRTEEEVRRWRRYLAKERRGLTPRRV